LALLDEVVPSDCRELPELPAQLELSGIPEQRDLSERKGSPEPPA